MLRRSLAFGFLASMLPAAGPTSWRGAAAGAETATGFVQALGRELPGVVAGATSEAAKRARLKPFLRQVVDLDRVERFCLARYWRLATPAQQAEYRDLFLDALATAVAARVGSYAADTRVSVLPELVMPDGIYVRTQVHTGDQPPVHITWVVDTTVTPYRILDVIAEGISLRLSQRADYTAFLDRHGGDMGLFLRALRAHVGG